MTAARETDVVERFRTLLEEAVRVRLMADVPLGMFLSGGLDSSAIAALMAGMIDRPLQTFSVAFRLRPSGYGGQVNDRAFSELDYARQVSTAIKADAHEIVIDDQDFFGALPKLIWHEDEPIAHPSSVPLYFVSELASQHVKVVLTGEGSDELLAGYGKYPRALVNWRAAKAYGLVPDALRSWISRALVPSLPGHLARYAKRSFLSMPRTPRRCSSTTSRRSGWRVSGPCSRRRTRPWRQPTAPTALRARSTTLPTGAVPCSIVCSMPT